MDLQKLLPQNCSKTDKILNKKFYKKRIKQDRKNIPNLVLLAQKYKPRPESLSGLRWQTEKTIKYQLNGYRKSEDSFVEDDAEELYLTTPPTCFIILGKKCLQLSQLVQDISQSFGCIAIDTENVINDVLNLNNTASGSLNFFISNNNGRIPSTNLLLGLIAYRVHSHRCRHVGYVLSGLPIYSSDVSAEEQFEYCFNWDIKPTIFIYYKMQSVGSAKESKSCENSEDEPPSDEHVQLIEAIEQIKAKVDPQNFIEIEKGHPNPISIISRKLELLNAWRPPLPNAFFPEFSDTKIEKDENVDDSHEGNSEMGEAGEYETQVMESCLEHSLTELSPSLVLPILLKREIIDERFKWELSHYMLTCPVALRESRIVNGLTKFAAVFMKYIYFLSSKAAMLLFLENPRPYVLPVIPKPTRRIILLGYSHGVTKTVARSVATLCEVPIIDLNILIERDRIARKKKYCEFRRDFAERMIADRLTAESWKKWQEFENVRMGCLEKWTEYMLEILNQRIEDAYDEVENEQGKEESNFDESSSISEPSQESEATVTSADSTIQRLVEVFARQDFDFHANDFRDETHMFFSALHKEYSTSATSVETDSTSLATESAMVMLPPQSLSSFDIFQKCGNLKEREEFLDALTMFTTRHKLKSDHLKGEFIKWKLPCYLDIPLCVTFRNNPLLLLKYSPEELKIRTEFPQPTDRLDPIVMEEGKKAYKNALNMNAVQTIEDIGNILNYVITKTETKGTRCSGETKSPGGWVLCNMLLDVSLWEMLSSQKHLPNYLFIVGDLQKDYYRLENSSRHEIESHLYAGKTFLEVSNPSATTPQFVSETYYSPPGHELLSYQAYSLYHILENLETDCIVDNQVSELEYFKQKEIQGELILQNLQLEEIIRILNNYQKTSMHVIELGDKTCGSVTDEILNIMSQDFGKRSTNFDLVRSETSNIASNGVEMVWKEVLGESGANCVVCLDRGILMEGKVNFVAIYYGKFYLFCCQQDMDIFNNSTRNYSPFYGPIRKLPPLTVCMIGETQDPTPHLARSIARHFDLHHLRYSGILQRALFPNQSSALRSSKLMLDLISNYPVVVNKCSSAVSHCFNKFMTLPFHIRETLLTNPKFLCPKHSHSPDEFILEIVSVFQQEERDNNLIESFEIPESYLKFLMPCDGSLDLLHCDEQTLRRHNELQMYIQGIDILDPEFVDATNGQLWSSVQYLMDGFVVEGYPFRCSDTQYIEDNKRIPDYVIEVDIPLEVVVDRLLNHNITIWRNKLLEAKKREHKTIQVLKTIYELLKNERRKDLLQKQNTAKDGDLHENTIRNQETVDNDENGASNDEQLISKERWSMEKSVEDIILCEFPELNFNLEYETIESATNRIRSEIEEAYHRNKEHNLNIRRKLEHLTTWLTISDTGTLRDLKQLVAAIEPTARRTSRQCEYAFEIDSAVAEALLTQGYYMLSKFGRFCPVQSFENINPVNMYNVFRIRDSVFTVVYRNYIYFLGGPRAKEKFISNPVFYIQQEMKKPLVPLRLAVIGMNQHQVSDLVARLADTFNLKVLTIGEALQHVTNEMSYTQLAATIKKYYRSGCVQLPVHLEVAAMESFACNAQCFTQGYVLNGYPLCSSIERCLTESNIQPFVVFSLNRQYIKDSLYLEFVANCNQTYGNVYETDSLAHKTPNAKFYWAVNIIYDVVHNIQHYIYNYEANVARKLNNLCVNDIEFQKRKSCLGNCCPVCWTLHRTFSESTENNYHDGLFQYGIYFYYVCPQHSSYFTNSPNIFIRPIQDCPLQFPVRLVDPSAIESSLVYGRGRCVVTYVDYPTLPLIAGSPNHTALFDKHYYLFQNEDRLQCFLAKPLRYFKAKVAPEDELENDAVGSELYEDFEKPHITGYLEQNLGTRLQKGLMLLGKFRPIHPRMSPTETAVAFMTLFMRAGNKNTRVGSIYKKRLLAMCRQCDPQKYLNGENGKETEILVEQEQEFTSFLCENTKFILEDFQS